MSVAPLRLTLTLQPNQEGPGQPGQLIMKGLALIDLPEHELKCGEYGDVPEKVARQLVKDGYFDVKAPSPDAIETEESSAEQGIADAVVSDLTDTHPDKGE